jgi:octaheme c-type cytochrome (tetrathionate reductase family)
MKKIYIISGVAVVAVLYFLLMILDVFAIDDIHHVRERMLKSSYLKKDKSSTADHSQFEELKKEFNSPEDVVKECLGCHSEAAKQVRKTIHWTWVCPKAKDQTVGKVTVINNFCMALPSNEPRCTSCHVGFGWADTTFNFNDDTKVDCFVCHDQTGTYKKFPTGAGYPVKDTTVFKGNGKTYYPVDWNYVAQNVGSPTKENCGTCHYFGGGGNKVKHGDLDAVMNNCDEHIDVHMAKEGLNFECVECHVTEAHRISGRCYAAPAGERGEFHLMTVNDKRILCESCHSIAPHKIQKINDHLDKVACQTCHIPIMAKGNATKMWWDWSKAGKLDDKGKPFQTKNDDGEVTYDSKKGEFKWARNIEPEYFWYNGGIEATTLENTFDPNNTPIQINKIMGSADDPDSRIMPFKVHRGIQPYDSKNNTFVVPKLFGKKGTGAFWAHFDWNMAIEAGMKYAGAPYSGEHKFIETEMYWLVSHMIAPREEALQCEDCHTPAEDGRMVNIAGVYIPGRDHSIWDTLGVAAMILTLIGVFVHGLFRIIIKK